LPINLICNGVWIMLITTAPLVTPRNLANTPFLHHTSTTQSSQLLRVLAMASQQVKVGYFIGILSSVLTCYSICTGHIFLAGRATTVWCWIDIINLNICLSEHDDAVWYWTCLIFKGLNAVYFGCISVTEGGCPFQCNTSAVVQHWLICLALSSHTPNYRYWLSWRSTDLSRLNV